MNKTPLFPLGVLVLTIALCTALSLTACDPAPDNNGNKDTPQQNRTGTVALDRGLGTITVQVMGMTTQAEWNDIANKIKDSVNNRVNADIEKDGEDAWLDGYTELFERGIIYIIEPNPVGYTIYKTTGDGKTIYIALDKVDTTVPGSIFLELYQKKTSVDGMAVPPHQTTITAFGKEATVIGDAALSTADFNTAKGKLEELLTQFDGAIVNEITRGRFVNMMERGITITVGDAAPAGVGGAFTVGVGYIKSNTDQTIGGAIYILVSDGNGPFVTPTTPLYTNPATITQGTPNGLAFAGSVTIKSDDTYTPAAWDAVVANVITAFNAAYNGGGNAAKSQFATVFANSANAQIVLVNNLDNNWEVRDGEFKTLYLKTGSIDTANYRLAIQNMGGVAPGVGNATPPKHRAFLAIGAKSPKCVILTHSGQNRANLLTQEA